MNILLTGTRHFVSLTAARELKKARHTVYTADSIDFDYTGFSLAVKKRFSMPSVRFAEQKYIRELIRIIQEYKIDRLIPLSEEIFYIARNIEKIKQTRPKIIVEADSIEALDTLHSKESFFHLASSLHLNIPPTTIVDSLDQIIKYQDQTHSDIVLKPVYSRFADRFLHFKNAKETKKHFAGTQFSERYVLQDFIKGKNISTFSLNDTSEIITYHSSVQMSRPGAMSSITRIDTPDAIREADQKLRESLGFKYQLALDFIETPTGELFLLEANPRATMGRMLIGRRHAQFRILAFHQFINGIIPKKSYPQFFKNLFFYYDAVSKLRDPLPVLVSQIGCVGLPSYLRFRKKHPGSSFQAYSTYDMEYNGDTITHKTVQAAATDSREVLRLIEHLSTRKTFQIAQTRRNNPLESFATDGKKVTVATVKSTDMVAYIGVCAENDLYVSGKAQPIGYLSSVRKNPDFLYQIAWRDSLYAHFRQQHKDVGIFTFAIMADNTHAIKSLTKKTSTVPTAQFLCSYKTFIVNAQKVKPAAMPRSVTFSKLTEKDSSQAISFLKTEGAKHDFFPQIKDLRKNFLDATTKNSYVLKQDREIVGFASILDQSHKKQFFIKKYASWLRMLKSPFNKLSRPMKLITMPDENAVITCPAISLCIVKDNDPKLFDLFFRQLSSEARRHSSIFTISMATDNPCIETLTSWWNLSIDYNFYMVDYSDKKIKPKNIYIDAAIL